MRSVYNTLTGVTSYWISINANGVNVCILHHVTSVSSIPLRLPVMTTTFVLACSHLFCIALMFIIFTDVVQSSTSHEDMCLSALSQGILFLWVYRLVFDFQRNMSPRPCRYDEKFRAHGKSI